MKKILLLLLCFTFTTSCSEDEDLKTSTESYISINGDKRLLDDSKMVELGLSSYIFNEDNYEPPGIQFVLDAYDPNENSISNIGGFLNNEIELFIDLYSPYVNRSHITFHENQTFSMSRAERKEFMREKAWISVRLKKDDRVTIYADALQDQNFTVNKEDGIYYIILDNMKFLSNENQNNTNQPVTYTLSSRFKIVQ